LRRLWRPHERTEDDSALGKNSGSRFVPRSGNHLCLRFPPEERPPRGHRALLLFGSAALAPLHGGVRPAGVCRLSALCALSSTRGDSLRVEGTVWNRSLHRRNQCFGSPLSRLSGGLTPKTVSRLARGTGSRRWLAAAHRRHRRRWPRHAGDRLGGLAGLGFKRLESTYRKGRAMTEAAAPYVQSLKKPIPVLACHQHFLSDIGKDLLEEGHHQLRDGFRQIRLLPR